MRTKRCPCCTNTFDLTEFCYGKSIVGYCRACLKLKRKQWVSQSDHKAHYQRYGLPNKEQKRTRNRAWKKANQDKIKAASKQYNLDNRESMNERLKRWRQLNPHRVAYYNAMYRLQRATQSDGTVSSGTYKQLYAQKFCHYCEEFVDSSERTVDHVIPLSRGGTHSVSNLVMACGSCNYSKQGRTPEEFLEYKRLIGEKRNSTCREN